MADHAHTQIRSAVVAALTGLATSGTRVFANRLYALAEANLPGLRVFTDSEEVSAESIHHPHLQSRRLSLVVEACARASADLDSTLDQMAQEIEIALAGPLTVGSAVLYPILTGSQFDDEAGSVPVGVKRLEFRLEFFTLNTAPSALI